MKKVNVLNFTQFLANLKLNKFDKDIRSAIISNSLIANKVDKEFNETVDGARTRFLEGLDDEVAVLIELRERFKTASEEEKMVINQEAIEKCSNALKAEYELNDFVRKLGEEEVVANFVKIDRDAFVDQCADADIEITMNTLELLNELFN